MELGLLAYKIHKGTIAARDMGASFTKKQNVKVDETKHLFYGGNKILVDNNDSFYNESI